MPKALEVVSILARLNHFVVQCACLVTDSLSGTNGVSCVVELTVEAFDCVGLDLDL